MAVLRQTVQREVLDILDDSIFTSDDFSVSFGDPAKNEFIVFIKFKADPKYVYGISKYLSGVKVKRSPGDFVDEDVYQCADFKAALDGIDDWCKEVRNELKASHPIYAEVDKLRELIQEHINFNGSEEEFSTEDIHNLRKMFEGLDARISKLESEKIITENQFNDFRSGLNQVKEDLEYYPKQTWISTATNKLVKIVMSIGKSKEGRALLNEGAKKLLGFDE